ncbi:MAG: DUF2835 domain-containing protein [Gammaproteobacteria bacterium]|nr:DUF2835 domain-containing protein [Gammaproteobacteria bacterium]MCW8983123.1 DUF2835 domain-containing protein [Gammaproteobacteria bacterium]
MSIIIRMASEIIFSLNISADEVLRYYQGAASMVSTRSIDGRSVRFPASRLRPFMTVSGVKGYFAISFDDNHKFIEMRQIS